ncbi:hypothetical protein LOCC1_G002460 [Lachnellula occidentalis]|uniref:Uncharacterized protein n=1 Tax=Lachnellula occidentalis TaxID=215460 RepID=A0A8H8UK37_9HELO|nr:hypothetical protein LOCC1_G002460 [Lachnellula occidentalis]
MIDVNLPLDESLKHDQPNISLGMAGLSPRPSHGMRRSSPTKYPRERVVDVEKHRYDTDSDDDSDYSSYPPSPGSSRDISGSYSSSQLLVPKKPFVGSQRPRSSYRLPSRIVRYLCWALISTVIIFILSLVRMSIVSARQVEIGGFGKRPPPPPAPWESFQFLTRYYGGIQTLLPLSENQPEYPLPEDEPPRLDTSAPAIRDIPTSQPFEAYTNQTSKAYLSEYAPVKECFLDAQSTIRVPQLRYYPGRPSGFPDNVVGSYELLGLPEDICFERYGRLGPYGHGYSVKHGGTGTGQYGDMEGSESVWEGQGVTTSQVDYRKVNWADAQKRCYQVNAARFEPKLRPEEPLNTFSVIDQEKAALPRRDKPEGQQASPLGGASNSTAASRKTLPRTAVVIRSFDDYAYSEEGVMNIRALISELSLGSGGEYDVHLLVEVKDEAMHPIWADAETYQEHLNATVPEEFRDIATLWSTTQMLMLYQGIFDKFTRGPDLPVHGSYRGLQMAMQHFAHKHPEYEFFWHWELDIRFTGHYYNLFSQLDSWTKAQPRKGLWERNGRFYLPSVHGSWEDFKQMVRVQVEMGTKSVEDIWSGIPGAKNAPQPPKGEKSIWGPERPKGSDDWFEIDNDPQPPTSYDKDKYTWGVNEDADLITFNPMFDPEGTSWLLGEDITGYNETEGLPPRRASIVTASRMSKRLLDTMHRETAFKKHHAFSEMWGPTVALQHGYKAVYAPHPMYVDREWPTAYLAGVLNSGKNGATGASRSSVFGEREHNLRGMTWYYNSGFAPNLWKRWFGLRVNNDGGEEFELTADEGKDGQGVSGARGGEGRMCLPPMLIHPVKGLELPVEELVEEKDIPEGDPSA